MFAANAGARLTCRRAAVSAAHPSGVITITTDFGHQGPFVGVMKGCILSRFAAAQIVDLTHEILVHWPAEAGFWLARSFAYFPAGTVHLAVVDPGVGTARDLLVVSAAGHSFVAPDNGLLAGVVSRTPRALIVRLAWRSWRSGASTGRAPPSTAATSWRRWRPSWPPGTARGGPGREGDYAGARLGR